MKYLVAVNGREHEVLVDGASIQLGGGRTEGSLVEVEGSPVLVVTVGGRVHRVLAHRRGTGDYAIQLGGYRFDVQALDERTRTIRELTRAAVRPAGAISLVAPMPGLVVRVLVGVGDRVAPGQGVVVVEAMKMENELRAPAAGTVRGVTVKSGDAVEKGALLVEIDSSG